MRFWKYRDREEVVDADGHVHHVGHSDAEVRDAYERGRKEERARRKRHPILGLIVFVLALVGGIMLFLAIRDGSFTAGGQAADQQVAVVQEKAPAVLATAGDKAEEVARSVGDKVGESRDDPAQPASKQ